MAGRRCTREEFEERFAFTLTALRQMMPTYQISSWLQKQFGISRNSARRYIARASARLAEEGGLPRLDRRARVGAMLETLISDRSVMTRDRIRAVTEYVKLYGLRDQTRQEEDVPQRDIRISLGDWRGEFKRRLEAGEVDSANGNGNGNGSGGVPPGGNGGSIPGGNGGGG